MIFFLNKQEKRVVPQDFKINTKLNHLKMIGSYVSVNYFVDAHPP